MKAPVGTEWCSKREPGASKRAIQKLVKHAVKCTVEDRYYLATF